ncbi:unnamed protein product, partial [Ectocarpus sp. 8 AP-2014]
MNADGGGRGSCVRGGGSANWLNSSAFFSCASCYNSTRCSQNAEAAAWLLIFDITAVLTKYKQQRYEGSWLCFAAAFEPKPTPNSIIEPERDCFASCSLAAGMMLGICVRRHVRT